MDKLIAVAAELGRAILPAAANIARMGLGAALELTGRLGSLALDLLKKKKSSGLRKKTRRLLRKTALISGTVAVLSVAGLVLTGKK